MNIAEAHAYILEGYLKAFDNLDEVIKIIKASQNRDEVRQQLMERFVFSERQASGMAMLSVLFV